MMLLKGSENSVPTLADGVEYGYVGAVRDVLKSGGCNCSRANFVGACLGAAYGCYDDSVQKI